MALSYDVDSYIVSYAIRCLLIRELFPALVSSVNKTLKIKPY